ncbi:MAG: lipoprotein [Gammaproteobacteria bacterium]
MKIPLTIAFLMGLMGLSLIGCGQSGPLYLPGHTPPPIQQTTDLY